MAREFPIANGKLVTDLDANGFKIRNAKGDGGELPDLSSYATREELNVVGNIAQGASNGASTAIGEVNKLQGTVEQKRDKTDNIAAADETQFTEWKFYCEVPKIRAALDANPPVMTCYDDRWRLEDLPEVEGYYPGSAMSNESCNAEATFVFFDEGYVMVGGGAMPPISATREKVTVTKSDEPYVTPTGVKNIAIPKYEFVDAAIANGVLTVAPYTNAQVASDGTEFTVAIGEGGGKMRDCQFTLDCTDLTTAPTITWGVNFHPRTDAETDFACVSGKRNVYWITEFAQGEFAVAGWQVTAGGAL